MLLIKSFLSGSKGGRIVLSNKTDIYQQNKQNKEEMIRKNRKIEENILINLSMHAIVEKQILACRLMPR